MGKSELLEIRGHFDAKLKVTEKLGTRENVNEKPENNGEIELLKTPKSKRNLRRNSKSPKKSGPERFTMKIPKTMGKSEPLKTQI